MDPLKISRARTRDRRGWVGSSVDMSIGRISVAKSEDAELVDRMRIAANAGFNGHHVFSNFPHNVRKLKTGGI